MNVRVFLFPATAVVAFLAPSLRAAEQIFDVTGIIRGRLEDRQLVIQHDEIPGYMPAMTMAFTVSDPADAARLEDGDHVRFRFLVGETKSTASNFTVTGREAPPAASKPAAPAKGSRLRAGDAVAAFALTTEDNRPFTPAAFRERLTIVTFIFTRCPVPEFCPAMALRFAQLQKAILADARLAGRARLLSITLDPDFDRPEILAAYGKAVGANPAIWRFATGARDEIAKLTKAFAVFNERNGATLDHSLCTALIGRDGRVIDIWRGNGWRTEEAVAALSRAAAE